MQTFIYILIDPITNEIRYVGKANNVKGRYKNHNNKSQDLNTHKRNWINKLRRQGFKPQFEIIDEIDIDKDDWKYWEKFWIEYFRFIGCNLTNYTSGGDGLTFGNQTSFKKGQGAKRVLGYNKLYEKVYEFESGIAAAAYFKVHERTISNCCSGVGDAKTTKNIAWFYQEANEEQIKKRFERVEFKAHSGNYYKGQISLKRQKVCVTNVKTLENNIFDCFTDAAKFIGVTQQGITFALKKNHVLKKQYKIERL